MSVYHQILSSSHSIQIPLVLHNSETLIRLIIVIEIEKEMERNVMILKLW
jgi:hypothetical protein